MLAAGETVVVAVSGGPDSVALLHLLHGLAPELGLSLHVAHFHHGLRGPEADEDARFVRDLAVRMGLSVGVGRADVRAFARRHKLSLQVAGRTLRYRFLRECLAEKEGQRIAVGHTLDDQAETVLMRMLRGAGPKGLGGIPPKRGPIIRPMLDVSRTDVLAYLKHHGAAYRMDSSNTRPACLRNRLRMELLPLLRTYNPQVVHALARSARIIREEEAVTETLIHEHLGTVLGEDGERRVTFHLPSLASLPPALQRRLLREGIRRAIGGLEGIAAHHVEALWELASRGRTGSRLCLPRGLEALRGYGDLKLSWSVPESIPREFCRPLTVPGTTLIQEAGISVTVEYASHPRGGGPDTVCFDSERLPGLLMVRSRKPGDRFYPVGMAGSKRLQDFFVDCKVPRNLRDRIPLLTAGDQILWVMGGSPGRPGGRVDRRYLAGPQSTRLLRIQVAPMETDSCHQPPLASRSFPHP